jgi:hypothetical protein
MARLAEKIKLLEAELKRLSGRAASEPPEAAKAGAVATNARGRPALHASNNDTESDGDAEGDEAGA